VACVCGVVPLCEDGDGGVARLLCECVVFLSLVVDCFFCGDCMFLFCVV